MLAQRFEISPTRINKLILQRETQRWTLPLSTRQLLSVSFSPPSPLLSPPSLLSSLCPASKPLPHTSNWPAGTLESGHLHPLAETSPLHSFPSLSGLYPRSSKAAAQLTPQRRARDSGKASGIEEHQEEGIGVHARDQAAKNREHPEEPTGNGKLRKSRVLLSVDRIRLSNRGFGLNYLHACKV